jgi:hypothetical protein
MSLLIVRHKPIRLFVWFTCFLTFYLGFNQQVMCFELNSDGEVYKLHLQLIECNPLYSSILPVNLSTRMSMSSVLSAGSSGNGCPNCRDFHLSFKRIQGIDISSLGALVSTFPADYPVLSNNLFATTISHKVQPTCTALNLAPKSNPSLTVLRTTVLLI